jgi:single-strand DNA-binding protein
MPNYNKVFLMGNLTRDPQISSLPSGSSACEFALAINRRWKGQDGQVHEEVSFVDCRAYGRTAENIGKYLTKGRPIFIEGRLKQDRWEDKTGQKRSVLRVFVENFQFIDSRGGEGGGGGAGGYQRSGGRPQAGAARGGGPTANAPPAGWQAPPAGGPGGPPPWEQEYAPADDDSPPAFEEDDIPF